MVSLSSQAPRAKMAPSGCNSVFLITGSNAGLSHKSMGSAGCTSCDHRRAPSVLRCSLRTPPGALGRHHYDVVCAEWSATTSAQRCLQRKPDRQRCWGFATIQAVLEHPLPVLVHVFLHVHASKVQPRPTHTYLRSCTPLSESPSRGSMTPLRLSAPHGCRASPGRGLVLAHRKALARQRRQRPDCGARPSGAFGWAAPGLRALLWGRIHRRF